MKPKKAPGCRRPSLDPTTTPNLSDTLSASTPAERLSLQAPANRGIIGSLDLPDGESRDGLQGRWDPLPCCRQAIRLRLQGYSICAIAKIVGVDEGTVRTMLKRVPRGPVDRPPVSSPCSTESPQESTFFDAEKIAAAIKSRWRRGERPDTQAALSDQPSLNRYRTLVLDLAYHEFRLRQQSGEAIDARHFCQRFANLQQSLYVLIVMRSLLAHDPDLQSLQTVLSWPESGDCFLQFELQSQIGEGAIGRVFVARQLDLGGRQVVVKVAPHAGAEASILARLVHNNIVPIYSLRHDETTGLEAFCMPYLGRATLADVLSAFYGKAPPPRGTDLLSALAKRNREVQLAESKPCDPVLRRGSYVDSVIHVVAQLADALAHSHDRGVFHRDLKPSNVLMTPWGQPLLLDFNLSVDVNLPICKIGGTLPYMAPEEVNHFASIESSHGAKRYDPRSDVFSLAVIAYEMLTLRLPFGEPPQASPLLENASAWLAQQKAGPGSIRTYNPEVNKSLAALIEQCLVVDPEQRPRSAKELATELRRQLKVMPRIGRWASTRKLRLGAAAAVVLAMAAAFAAASAARPSQAERYISLGLTYFEERQYQQTVSVLTDLLVISPRSYDAYLLRGHAYKRLGEFALAAADYRSASRMKPDSISYGCEAYCLTELKDISNAISRYNTALRENHPSPAILHNNLGYCHLAAGEITKAQKHLAEAIRLDAGLQVAHFNMAVCYVKKALRGAPLSAKAMVHARKAIEIGPDTADLYWVAAQLCAITARNDPSEVGQAQKFILRALECGKSADEFRIGLFAAVQSDPAFAAKFNAAKQQMDAPRQPSYLDPSP